ncbi:hypothetical protein [Arthrobacter sp. R-11]|uniref:DUF7793 family protein n=1 Tax=Arthrobacter sp. R-11 TaxID=3404053 RepID=UPI003CF1F883
MSNQQIAPHQGATDLGSAGTIEVELADDGIVEVVLPVCSEVRAPEAQAAAAVVRAMSDGRKRPVLMTLTGVLDINDGARAVYAAAETVSAFALVGETPVDRVLAHFLLRATPESIPARFFASEAAAREWLAGYL